MRRSAVRRLGDGADAPLAEVGLEPVEDALDRDAGLPRRVDVGPDQPRPHRSLVIRGVALGRRAAVVRPVGRVVGRQRAQAERRQERARHASTTPRASEGSSAERPVRQRDGEQLVRPHRRSSPRGRRPRRADPARPGRRSGERMTAAPSRRAPRHDRRRANRPAISSAATQSAFTSTALPCRGVTGAPSMRASIQVRRQAVRALPQQPVGGVDCRSRSACRRDDAETISVERRGELGREVVVTGHRHVAAERMDEPERPVGRVVLERPRVGRVREHALGDGGGRAAQHARALVEPPRGEEEPLVRRHHVARPFAEPRVAGDRRGAGGASRSRTGRPRARAVASTPASAPAVRTSAPARSRAARTIAVAPGARRRTAPPPPSPRCASPAPSSATNVPAAHMSSIA